MKKTLYLMRHGQTLFNQQKRIQGWCDSPLTPEGISQARSAYAYFQTEGIQFDGLYCSTQERACDTVELVTGRTDYTRLKALKEMSFGVFEGAPEYLHINRREGANSFEDVYLAYGGEDIREVGKRVEQCLRQILDNESGRHFLAVSHGGAMWGFFLGLKLVRYPTLRFSNCCILQFEYEDGVFELVKVIDPVNYEVFELEDSFG
ncbi:histidine phosphatase family protein [Aerococcaceae bacterium NML191292]|nr:histidine phosphatase family protein [Aerococcaceae bacterium NML210727]MCW6655421.1 histidine phosphatase family protein [Aerococcaceae bacterium NML201296]MCW6660407.1 histidine phosphatase family protein [Aerococcaceae bacterium NML191292]MCW6675162.1 histidine phosphatase family protein [Aerococcaceae bacterium NML171108]